MRLNLLVLFLAVVGCASLPDEQSMTSDPDFGSMKFNGIDAWDCRVDFDFPHPKTKYFAIHLWQYDPAGPTSAQRECLRRLKEQYAQLWPDIAGKIIAVHETVRTQKEVEDAMPQRLAAHIGEQGEDAVELVIDLDLPGEGSRGYFIPIVDWQVQDAIVAE